MGKPLMWTPERVSEMRAMWDGGVTLREIAAHYGISVGRVSVLSRQHGFRPRRKLATWTAAEERMLCALSRQRLTLRQIAAEMRAAGYPCRGEMGLHRRLCNLRRAGRANGLRQDKRDWILATLPGLTAEIAKALGEPRSNVGRILWACRQKGLAESVPGPRKHKGHQAPNYWTLTDAGREYLYGDGNHQEAA